jgi:DNA-binding XRE family transcriptional regulator
VPRIGSYKGPVDEKVIGQRLRGFRKQRGLTQNEVAEKLGTQQALLSAYELGQARVHGVLVAAFADLSIVTCRRSMVQPGSGSRRMEDAPNDE